MEPNTEYSFTGVFFVGSNSTGWALYSHAYDGNILLCGSDRSSMFTSSGISITINGGYNGYLISI